MIPYIVEFFDWIVAVFFIMAFLRTSDKLWPAPENSWSNIAKVWLMFFILGVIMFGVHVWMVFDTRIGGGQ
jgi:hypothetical protein